MYKNPCFKKKNIKLNIFNDIILLPTTVNELNNIIESSAAKKNLIPIHLLK